jgi:hypothetical protein
MTRRASTLRPEQTATAGLVTQTHRAHVYVPHVPEEGDQAGQLGPAEVIRWHRRVGDAGLEQTHQFLVRARTTVSPTLQVDTHDAVTRFSVTPRAIRVVEAYAKLDISLRVLPGMVLGDRGLSPTGQQQETDDESGQSSLNVGASPV